MKIYFKDVSLFVLLFIAVCNIKAQTGRVTYYYTVEGTDTIINALLPQVIIFPTLVFNNEEEWKEYAKLVRDVKKTLPYANQITKSMLETYEFMETLPDKKSKEEHLKKVQKYIVEDYKPKMKKLTKKQGLILIKLINRQTNSSAYDIIKAVAGPFKASYFNIFAGLMGNSLKTKYDPTGKDKMIERILIEIRQGTL